MKLFDPDSPFMQALTLVGHLILLNVVCLLCCIPIVTVGASFTALYTVTLRLADGNEKAGPLTAFFQAFKRNFRQATVIWLIFLALGAALALDGWALLRGPLIDNKFMTVLFFVGLFFYVPTLNWVFPVLAKFDNTVFHTIKNALALSFGKFPRTILILSLNALPLILLYISQWLFLRMLILWLLVATSATALLNSYLFRGVFRKLTLPDDNQASAANSDNRP